MADQFLQNGEWHLTIQRKSCNQRDTKALQWKVGCGAPVTVSVRPTVLFAASALVGQLTGSTKVCSVN